ncbi:uncharacterized protein tmem79a isoform 1-T2 [Odontesthes bonariensis]|uniref:uncharacterized protein tmem79a n=1 Tax=Odontesthes bonariensis TaxID=219752 RepID=UPI003F588B13
MSGQGDSDVPAGAVAEPQIKGSKKPQGRNSVEERMEITDEEEEEMASSAHLEPSTLPWPGDQGKRHLLDQKDDTGISVGSQDLSEDQSQTESGMKSKAKWRESMPEGERWRDDEIEVQRSDKGDGSLADDEREDDDEEERDGESVSEKPAFTPQVTIVNPFGEDLAEETRYLTEKEKGVEEHLQMDAVSAVQFYPEWEDEDDKYYICEDLCSEKLRLALAMVAAGLLFPLLVWGGYALLPFDSPLLDSAPLRVMYTLRCSFFAIVPIMLGVVVQGVARLRYSALKPLFQGELVNKEVMVHWHFVNESLALFLFYFLQLAVMATYISQDLLKLVPLLTIIFVFGRLIYWLCLSLGSTIRAFGYGFSFFPIFVMLGVNLYYVCSSVGQGSVFDVETPTAAPPPKLRWWG